MTAATEPETYIHPSSGRAWAQKRTADGLATLLVHVDPVHGIRQADADRAGEWARAASVSLPG